MKRYLGYMGMVIVCGLFLVCLGRTIGYKEQIGKRGDILYLSCKTDSISPLQLLNIEKNEEGMEEKLSITGWYKKQEQIVLNEDFNREKTTEAIYLLGDSDTFIESSYSLLSDDSNGCIITSNLSYELFGSMDGKNRTIHFGKRDLLVREVIEHQDNMLFVQAVVIDMEEEEQGQKIPDYIEGIAIATDAAQGQDIDSVYNLFLSRYNLEPIQKVDTIFIKWISACLICVLPICCIIYIIFQYGKKGIQCKQETGHSCFSLIVLVLWIAMIIWSVDWPGLSIHMIPNKWSDFSFWTDMYEDYKGQMGYIIEQGQNYPYIMYRELLGNIAVFSVASILFLVVYLGLVRYLKISNIFILEVIIIILSYFIFIDLYEKEILRDYLKMYYLFPVILLAAVLMAKDDFCNTRILKKSD